VQCTSDREAAFGHRCRSPARHACKALPVRHRGRKGGEAPMAKKKSKKKDKKKKGKKKK
jgi:hypothetical protein